MLQPVRNILMLGLMGISLSIPALSQTAAPAANPPEVKALRLAVERTLTMDFPVDIVRLSVGDGSVADGFARSSNTVLVNAKKTGSTTVIVWLKDGTRRIFQLTVIDKNQ